MTRTATNRDLVDTRLKELNCRRKELELRLEELDRLSVSQGEIQSIVSDSMQFLAGLEHILRNGVPEEKQMVLRRCINDIQVDRPAGEATVSLSSGDRIGGDRDEMCVGFVGVSRGQNGVSLVTFNR